jgi:prevent-host-death family protein
MVMKRSRINKKETIVNIATLKAKLAKYLRFVKSGEEVVVLDHKMPVAKIIPFETNAPLESIKPQGPFSDIAKMIISPMKTKLKVDSLTLLLEDRSRR